MKTGKNALLVLVVLAISLMIISIPTSSAIIPIPPGGGGGGGTKTYGPSISWARGTPDNAAIGQNVTLAVAVNWGSATGSVSWNLNGAPAIFISSGYYTSNGEPVYTSTYAFENSIYGGYDISVSVNTQYGSASSSFVETILPNVNQPTVVNYGSYATATKGVATFTVPTTSYYDSNLFSGPEGIAIFVAIGGTNVFPPQPNPYSGSGEVNIAFLTAVNILWSSSQSTTPTIFGQVAWGNVGDSTSVTIAASTQGTSDYIAPMSIHTGDIIEITTIYQNGYFSGFINDTTTGVSNSLTINVGTPSPDFNQDNSVVWGVSPLTYWGSNLAIILEGTNFVSVLPTESSDIAPSFNAIQFSDVSSNYGQLNPSSSYVYSYGVGTLDYYPTNFGTSTYDYTSLMMPINSEGSGGFSVSSLYQTYYD